MRIAFLRVSRGSTGFPHREIVQTPGFVVIVYEAFNLSRQIFLDGRGLGEDFTPSWLGYSTGKWEGDTLVVSRVLTARPGWIRPGSQPRMPCMSSSVFGARILAPWIFKITIDDPKAYTKPWTINEQARLLPATELMEFIC